MTVEQQDAVEEFRHCAREYIADPNSGTLYALKMAVAECGLLGVDPGGNGVPSYILRPLLADVAGGVRIAVRRGN